MQSFQIVWVVHLRKLERIQKDFQEYNDIFEGTEIRKPHSSSSDKKMNPEFIAKF